MLDDSQREMLAVALHFIGVWCIGTSLGRGIIDNNWFNILPGAVGFGIIIVRLVDSFAK
jgi:hypothetical protein